MSTQTLAAIEAIYAAAAAPDRWPAALDALAACFDAVGTVLILQQPDGSTATIASASLAAAGRDYDAGDWKLDFMVPRVAQIALASQFGCYTDRHLATPQEIASHPFYTEFRARHGLGPFLGGVFFPVAERPAILTMQGRASRPPFTDVDVEAYSALVRHAERSLLLAIRLLEAESRATIFGDALDQLACGVFVLDATGQLTFTNAVALEVLGGELAVHGRRLRVNGADQSAFEKAVARATGGRLNVPDMHPGAFLVRGPKNREPAALYVLPIRQSDNGAGDQLFTTARAVVLAVQQHADQPIDPMILRDMLKLTPGEARLATLVGSGRSPRDAAQALNITEDSARTILKRVFVKAGVSRQSELAALLSRLTPRRLEPRR